MTLALLGLVLLGAGLWALTRRDALALLDEVALGSTGHLEAGHVVRLEGVLRADGLVTSALGDECVYARLEVYPFARRQLPGFEPAGFVPLHRKVEVAPGLRLQDADGVVALSLEGATVEGEVQRVTLGLLADGREVPPSLDALDESVRRDMASLECTTLAAGARVTVAGPVEVVAGVPRLGGAGLVVTVQSPEARRAERRRRRALGFGLAAAGVACGLAAVWRMAVG